MARRCFSVEEQCRPTLVRKNELELTRSECSPSEQIVERDQEANPHSKTTEYGDTYGLLKFPLGVGVHIHSTKISIARTENMCTPFDERKYELLNKGDLIEFRLYHSFKIRHRRYSHPDVCGKAKSHWAVYVGSGTIEGQNTPYSVKEFTDVSLTNMTKSTLKVVYTKKEQDSIKSIVRVGAPFHVAKVENAEPYQNNPMDEMFNSTKSSTGRTVNTSTQFEERKYEQVLNKGDLFEFRPHRPYSHSDSRVHREVDSKAYSHWAVYIGSGTIEGPKTHYCIIPQTLTTNRTKIILIVSYPTEDQDKNIDLNLKDSDELKMIVRIGELLQIAKVQNAKTCQNKQMDKISKLKAKEQDKDTDINKMTDSDESKTIERTDDPEVQSAVPYQNNQMNEISKLKPVIPTKEQDKDTDIKVTDSDESKKIERTDDPEVQNAEPYQNNQMNEISKLKPVYPTKVQDKDIDIKLTDSDESKTIVRTDDPEVQSAEPYQNNQMNEISKLKPDYPTNEQDKNTDIRFKDNDIKLTDSDESKTIVRMDDPEVQSAEPYQNNQMNEISKLKPVIPTKEQDKDTDIKLTDFDESKTIERADYPEVQIAEPYQNNPMDEVFNSTKTSVGRTVNTRTQLDEITYDDIFHEGDLIKFRPYHSRTIRYPPYSHPDTEKIVNEDVRGKVKSHWAVYLGSGKVAHVAGPNTPCCVKVPRDIQTAKQRTCLQKAVYPVTVEDKDSDELKTIVRIDELLQVAKVQNAEPCKNNEMDKKYIAGTPTEIVNIAKHLVGISLPHDFITKDCKDFAFFCRYGENLHSLKETQQHEHSMNKIMCMGILVVVIAIIALKFSKLL